MGLKVRTLLETLAEVPAKSVNHRGHGMTRAARHLIQIP